jgi:hypothetical protein
MLRSEVVLNYVHTILESKVSRHHVLIELTNEVEV